MMVLTHRGLDPSRENFFLESSYEAFENQLQRGFGLEFDLQLTKDHRFIISHEPTLAGFTSGKRQEAIKDLLAAEIKATQVCKSRLIDLQELLDLIETKLLPRLICALHLKHHIQRKETLDLLLTELIDVDHDKLILFDVKPEIAQYLKSRNPKFHLAPSVAHTYDIERFSTAVGNTLISVEEAIKYRDTYDWVWLDEWDRKDSGGKQKALYTRETFDTLRSAGFHIALVTPELHGTSPGLLGGETHEDSSSLPRLTERLAEIITLRPDAICTDYPDLSTRLQSKKRL